MNDSWTLIKLNPIQQERYVDHVTDNEPSIELYFPQYQKITRPHRCRNPILLTLPVYPGYIFAKIDPETDSIHRLTSTPFQAYFIRFGKSISVVPDPVITDLKRRESLNLLMKEMIVEDPYSPGRKVRIHHPVADIEGIILQLLGRNRLVVDTELGLATVARAAAALL